MAFQHAVQRGNASKKRKQVRYATRTDLDKLIGKLCHRENRNPFAVVLVVQENGTSSFKTHHRASRLRESMRLRMNPQLRRKKPEDAGRGKFELQKKLSESSDYAEVTLAGARYRLYSHRCSFVSTPDSWEEKRQNRCLPRHWPKNGLFVGLVRADAFVPKPVDIVYIHAVAFRWHTASGCGLSLPETVPIQPIERLHAGEVVTIAVSACVVAAALTLSSGPLLLALSLRPSAWRT